MMEGVNNLEGQPQLSYRNAQIAILVSKKSSLVAVSRQLPLLRPEGFPLSEWTPLKEERVGVRL